MDWLLWVALIGWICNPVSFQWVDDELNPDWLITSIVLTMVFNIMIIPFGIGVSIWKIGELGLDKFRKWKENRNRARLEREARIVSRQLREQQERVEEANRLVDTALTASGLSLAQLNTQQYERYLTERGMAARAASVYAQGSQMMAQQYERHLMEHARATRAQINPYTGVTREQLETRFGIIEARHQQRQAEEALRLMQEYANQRATIGGTFVQPVTTPVEQDIDEGFNKVAFLKEAEEYIKESKGEPKE